MAAVYRAYYALGRTARKNSKGMNTAAALGFTTTLYDLLRQQPMTIGQLLSNFDAIDETPIRNIVRQMLDSRLIGIDNQLRLYC